MMIIRMFALAGVASAAFAMTGCASVRLSDKEAAMPVYAAAQSHPAVVQALGPVKAYVCQWSKNEASVVGEALNSLRSSADAKGATALVDYSIAYMERPARAQQCQHYVEAKATAVVLGGSPA
jgi:uncharacterized protein YbjQ (UPF0145 family)